MTVCPDNAAGFLKPLICVPRKHSSAPDHSCSLQDLKLGSRRERAVVDPFSVEELYRCRSLLARLDDGWFTAHELDPQVLTRCANPEVRTVNSPVRVDGRLASSLFCP